MSTTPYTLHNELKHLLNESKRPKRTALSTRFPRLKKPILFTRRASRTIQNHLDPALAVTRSKEDFPYIIARHQSLLRRKLGDSDPRLQEAKITNLAQAIKEIDGVCIDPGKIFSYWHLIGKPSSRKGYVNGMLLSQGKVVEGLGGGLCQLSNFLCWIFLHAPTKIIERYHHSLDAFPDSGRTLPFGSGATVLYNFVDFKVQNLSDTPLQLRIWLTDTHVKGELRSTQPAKSKFHLFEKNHLFLKDGDTHFRYNELWQEELKNGELVDTKLIAKNFAPVLYRVDEEKLRENGTAIVDGAKL